MQLTIFDILDQNDNNEDIAELINCPTSEYRVLNAINKSIDKLINLPKSDKYIIYYRTTIEFYSLLGVYIIYLELGYQELDISIIFSDEILLNPLINKTKDLCENLDINCKKSDASQDNNNDSLASYNFFSIYLTIMGHWSYDLNYNALTFLSNTIFKEILFLKKYILSCHLVSNRNCTIRCDRMNSFLY